MAIMKLAPACKDYIWGGNKLINFYNKKYSGNRLAETWEVSCHDDGPSIIAEGDHAGESLKDYINEEGISVLGSDCERFADFPILVKLIDARDNLSIQVHPGDEYARKNEGQNGKTEMWYICECDEGAFLYYGFNRQVDDEEFKRRIRENTLPEVLNKVRVKKGDVFFIKSGTIHAIGAGILVAEIQQNSNDTYRVYDYGRKDKDGNERELHIDKALEVTDKRKMEATDSCEPHIAQCEYFTVDKIYLDGKFTKSIKGYAGKESFVSILVLDGEGTISQSGKSLGFKKGDSIFISAGSGDYEIEGMLEGLMTRV